MAERKAEHTSEEVWQRDGRKLITSRGIICIVPTPQNGGVFDCEANLNKIAAAPDLLKACQAGLDELIGLHAYLTTCEPEVIVQNIDSLAYKMNDVRATIEAAIHKAEGGE